MSALINATSLQDDYYDATSSTGDKVILGYYAPWDGGSVESIPFSKYTHINYAFGLVYKRDDPAHIEVDPWYDGPKMKKLVELSHQNGVKVLLSIGGWTGGQTYSVLVKEEKLRRQYIDEAIAFLKDISWTDPKTNGTGWGFDGIDIDWEYPGRPGISCNEWDHEDSSNYLRLLRELRAEMNKQFPGERKLLTAAVRVEPFDGPNGRPMRDISQFMNIFDYISLMAYDLMGPWSKITGPNAPLDCDERNPENQYSLNQAIDSWSKAGASLNKLVAGIPFYGRSSTAKVDMLLDKDNMYQPKEDVTPKGDESDSNEVNRICPEAPTYSGFYKYKYLRKDILVSDPYTPEGDWTRIWDTKTKTPWLFNTKDNRFISYDDPESIRLKVDSVRNKGLRGVMCWDISLDYNDELVDILNLVKKPPSVY
jgi:chitinase